MGREGPRRRALSPLDEALRGPPARRFDDVAGWWAAQGRIQRSAASPWEAAVRGGAVADRVGWAFAAGYQAALWALRPDGHDRSRPAALCATEAGGVHPRAIATTWDGALRGAKTFVTLGPHAEVLLVLARDARDLANEPAVEGPRTRVPLVLVACRRDGPGVAVESLPPAPFVPEIPHGAVTFEGAPGEVLPGDGWADHVRPFRTLEDVHVHAAFVAWAVARGARWGWPRGHRARGASILSALRALADADPSSPAVHVALAGAIDATRAWVEEAPWDDAPADDRERWARDRPLLEVAGRARASRLAKAWDQLAG